jgi:hypothetical protein
MHRYDVRVWLEALVDAKIIVRCKNRIDIVVGQRCRKTLVHLVVSGLPVDPTQHSSNGRLIRVRLHERFKWDMLEVAPQRDFECVRRKGPRRKQ